MFELLLRIGFSLVVVLGLMWMLARVARRPLSRRGGGDALAVLARQQLTRGSSVALVRVADRTLILGVTEAQVSLLGEAELGDEPQTAVSPQSTPAPRPALPAKPAKAAKPARADGRLQGSLLSARTWTQTVEFLRERTVRR